MWAPYWTKPCSALAGGRHYMRQHVTRGEKVEGRRQSKQLRDYITAKMNLPMGGQVGEKC